MRKWFVLAGIVLLASALVTARPQEERGKDGKFHDPATGEVQPDRCSNSYQNPHKCRCNHAVSCDKDAMKEHPTPTPGEDVPADPKMGARCQTWCRTDHCDCINECGS